jgi:hypothetical protein
MIINKLLCLPYLIPIYHSSFSPPQPIINPSSRLRGKGVDNEWKRIIVGHTKKQIDIFVTGTML